MAFAQAQEDPALSSLERDWAAMNTAMIHVAEDNVKLVQAYRDLRQKASALEAYWKSYVDGATPK